MTQTAPAVVPSVPTSPSPVAPAQEAVAHRITLRGVPWSLYEQLLQVVGDGLPRLTYDRGTLEMEMLSKRHETLRWIAGRFIEAYAEESGINYEPTGSTTWHRASIEGGLEADESYYIQNYTRVRGREVNLAVDPPPDLAVEIDLSPPDVEKASIYARLGVPEIWRWRDDRLIVLIREAGGYVERPQSVALPDFPFADLAAALHGYPQIESAAIVAAFRRRLRGSL